MGERPSLSGPRPSIEHIPTESSANIAGWETWGDNPDNLLMTGFLNFTQGIVDGLVERTPRGKLASATLVDSAGRNMVFISRLAGSEPPSMKGLEGYFEALPFPPGERRGNSSPHYQKIMYVGLRTGGRAFGATPRLVYVKYGPRTEGDISTYDLQEVLVTPKNSDLKSLSDEVIANSSWQEIQKNQADVSPDGQHQSLFLPDDQHPLQLPTTIVLGVSSQR